MAPWYGDEERQAVAAYMASGGWLTEFTQTRAFEEMIEQYVGCRHAVVVSNGTVSLVIALLALDIGQGDEVLVPDCTFIASANAVLLAGATPVLVDVDRRTLCVDLERAEEALTSRTKAMVFVPLNGRSGNMHDVVGFCRAHDLRLVEDAAQALGSRFAGQPLGTFGDVGSLSFSVPKVITTGQGGALLLNDDALHTRVTRIKDFGRPRPGVDDHRIVGYNFKFTDLQAVVGIEQMKKLPWRVERKKAMYRLYRERLERIPGVEFIDTDLTATSPYLIDVLVPLESREGLVAFLADRGIGTRHFCPAIHTQPPYSHVRGDFPVAEAVARRGLWLPSSSSLTDREITYVCEQIEEYFRGQAGMIVSGHETKSMALLNEERTRV
jgi:perosamine synthetase